jgi:hypothetical protein
MTSGSETWAEVWPLKPPHAPAPSRSRPFAPPPFPALFPPFPAPPLPAPAPTPLFRSGPRPRRRVRPRLRPFPPRQPIPMLRAEGIARFRRSHTCNHICRALKLPQLVAARTAEPAMHRAGLCMPHGMTAGPGMPIGLQNLMQQLLKQMHAGALHAFPQPGGGGALAGGRREGGAQLFGVGGGGGALAAGEAERREREAQRRRSEREKEKRDLARHVPEHAPPVTRWSRLQARRLGNRTVHHAGRACALRQHGQQTR